MIDNFSKIGWRVPLKKDAQTIKNSFEDILNSSKRRPNLIESDDGYEFLDKNFANLLNNNKIERQFTKTSLGALFAKRFNRTMGYLLKKPLFRERMLSGLMLYPQKPKIITTKHILHLN